jgi:hypothetical protein
MKTLLLRVHASKYSHEQLEAISNCFKPYFKDVQLLLIETQRAELNDFIRSVPGVKVISLDKFLPLEHNLDVSRVFNIHGKYQYHNIKYPGRIAKDEHVILYDHDSVGGIQLRMLTALLGEFGCTVSTYVLYSPEEYPPEEYEILDLADFVDKGLVVDFNGTLTRVPYFVNPEILEARASIPKKDYDLFKTTLLHCLTL